MSMVGNQLAVVIIQFNQRRVDAIHAGSRH
jgi:hypothetical protein